MKKIHIFYIRKIWWLWGVVGMCCLLAVGGHSAVKQVIAVSATSRQLPIYSVAQEEKILSISFDAAWGNEDTQELIDILETYDVKATFFVVGDWVERFPESVLALHQAGHEIMNHSNTHAHYPKLSPEEIVADLNACNDKIEAITGIRPTLVRLPYGDYDDHVITTIRAMGMEPIQWDVDSHDWMDISAKEIAERVISKTASGSIVLFHNAALHTPEALPVILETLQSQGYSFVKISEILLEGDYILDHTGKQQSA
ncbi:MAG: polysaccharide deacetylase family protein [Eubacteriales bacterium]